MSQYDPDHRPPAGRIIAIVDGRQIVEVPDPDHGLFYHVGETSFQSPAAAEAYARSLRSRRRDDPPPEQAEPADPDPIPVLVAASAADAVPRSGAVERWMKLGFGALRRAP